MISRSKRPRLTVTLALATVAALTLGACGKPDPEVAGGGSGAQSVALPDSLLKAAKSQAIEDNDGKRIGGSISLIGIVSGPQGAILQAAIKPFEEATGVKVNYTGTHDANTIVATRIAAGSPPDIYYAGTAGGLDSYLNSDALVDLSSFMDMDELKDEYDPELLNTMVRDGKLYGLYGELDSYVLWYNPTNYGGPKSFTTWADLRSWSQKEADSGTAPWCMAYSQGAGTGAAATYFIENIMLSLYGPDVVAKFTRGELPFTSPQVKKAFREFADIAGNEKKVAGGPNKALSTPTSQVGAGMFTDPKSCSMTYYGQFGQNVFVKNSSRKLTPGKDTDFASFPAGNSGGSQLINGHVAYMMQDNPQAKAFMRYYASPEFQSLLAAGGEWTVANKKVGDSVLPNEPMRHVQKEMNAAKSQVLGALTAMNPVLLSAYYKACVSIIGDPSAVDDQLRGLETTRLANQ
ncbi:ABC transporter substrate-binding protein [Streptomyces olivaceus]